MGEAMSTELTGRELDEAAARAMGWTFITFPNGPCPDVKHWKHPEGEYHWRKTPSLSTDPAHIPEMLAWLRKFASVEMFAWRNDDVEAATIHSDRHRLDCRVGGSTLSEALARLVVAVAEAEVGPRRRP